MTREEILDKESCKMTADEYRQRLIQAFRNAGCDELVAICVLPTEKEFEHLEWLLKNHYKQESSKDMGEVSDGYHTFNQLYHQRAILFATIVNQNKNISWKSYKHSDGKYCFDSNGEWFIVGIDTPEGSYTYHYKKEYWDYFDCKELDCGKEWDGHTEEDVTRLLSLEEYTLDQLEAEIDWEKDWLARAGYNAYNVSLSFDSIKNILRKEKVNNE
jgi:hypothetical protein